MENVIFSVNYYKIYVYVPSWVNVIITHTYITHAIPRPIRIHVLIGCELDLFCVKGYDDRWAVWHESPTNPIHDISRSIHGASLTQNRGHCQAFSFVTLSVLTPLWNPCWADVSEVLDNASVLWYNGWLAFALSGRFALKKPQSRRSATPFSYTSLGLHCGSQHVP